MAFEIHYFHERVYAEVQSWHIDVLADYAPLVTVCLNYVREADRALVGRFIVFLQTKRVIVLHAFMKKSLQTPDNELKMAKNA